MRGINLGRAVLVLVFIAYQLDILTISATPLYDRSGSRDSGHSMQVMFIIAYLCLVVALIILFLVSQTKTNVVLNIILAILIIAAVVFNIIGLVLYGRHKGSTADLQAYATTTYAVVVIVCAIAALFQILQMVGC